MDELLLVMPGVTAGKMFGYPAYRIGRKVFAFVGGPGIAIKLPKSRGQALINQDEEIDIFEPVEGRMWREWISINRKNPYEYQGDQDLFEESVQFVADADTVKE